MARTPKTRTVAPSPVKGRAPARPKTTSSDARLRLPAERLNTPTDLSPEASREISAGLTELLSDFFALYLKTKNFHWHISGPNFRDYHLLLDDHADEIFAATDDVAERARRIGGTTLRSLGQAAKLTRVSDNDAEYVDPLDMMAELRDDNKATTARMRELHELCDKHDDVATASLIENWIDQSENRTWWLYEITRSAGPGGH